MTGTRYLPEDAGEYADDLAEILDRIPDGWGRFISCKKGWYRILADTNRALRYLDPDYEVNQVKEKFGTLRYYFEPSGRVLESSDREIVWNIMNAVADHYESRSAQTCEYCGAFGTSRRGRWIKTLCAPCALQQGYKITEYEQECLDFLEEREKP